MSRMDAERAVTVNNYLLQQIKPRQDPITITQVLPTYINIYTYTITYRNTFTIDQTVVNRS